MPPAVVPPMSSAVSASVTTRERKGSPFGPKVDRRPRAACALARSLSSSSSSGDAETRSSRRRSATSSRCSGSRSWFESVICSLIRTAAAIRNRNREKNLVDWRERAPAPIIAEVRDDEFERLYAAHAEALLGFLVYRTGDRVLAEDVVADTFERILRTRVRFDPRKSSEKTWVYTIAMNLLRDQARRTATESRALEHAAQPVGGGAGPLDLVD